MTLLAGAVSTLEQPDELLHREVSLPQYRTKRSWRELSVQRHDYGSTILSFELRVAPALPDSSKTDTL